MANVMVNVDTHIVLISEVHPLSQNHKGHFLDGFGSLDMFRLQQVNAPDDIATTLDVIGVVLGSRDSTLA